MIYVYGVVRAGHPGPASTGVGDPPAHVGMLDSGELAAAVSEVTEITLGEDDARRHLQVLIDLLADGPVVPVRMGTVADTEDEVRIGVLDANAETFAEALEALDGLVEVWVDADEDEQRALSEAALAVRSAGGVTTTAAASVAERIEQGEQVAALLVERRARLAETVLARLRPAAVDDAPRAEHGGPEDPVLRWAFLVRSGELQAFDAAVGSAQAAHPDLLIGSVGPLPAAHFVQRRPATPAAEPYDTFRGDGNWDW